MPHRSTGRSPSLRGNRIVVAFNPIAGAGDRQSRVALLLAELKKAGFEAVLCPSAEALPEVVARFEERGELRGVVAAGGDGTFSHVANCLPAHTTLAVFPLGTENLLAHYLGHKADPRVLARLFLEGHTLSLDAGVANGRLFSLMAGCGWDAEVVHRLHSSRRGHIRHWSYIKPILDAIRTYAYPLLRVNVVDAAGVQQLVECRWAFIVNVPRYAFGIQFDRNASPCDGLLNVVTFRDGSLYRGLQYLSALVVGRHEHSEGVAFHEATSVRVESTSLARYQVDGDPGGDLPLEIGCQRGRLRVLVSQEWLHRYATNRPTARSEPPAADEPIAVAPSFATQTPVD